MIAKKLSPNWFCDELYELNPDILIANGIEPSILPNHQKL